MLPTAPSRLSRAVLAGAVTGVLALGASACGSDGVDHAPGGSSSFDSSSAVADADLVGPGCADYVKQVPDGTGSIQGMAKDPVATAAADNPLLSSLTKAVSGQLNPRVNLVNQLNRQQLTVFAPVDDAFAKLPGATATALADPARAALLTRVLDYHLVAGQLAPSSVEGERTTLQGGTVTVRGSGDEMTVNGAKVICGGLRTANATVYLIDTVMDPAGGHF